MANDKPKILIASGHSQTTRLVLAEQHRCIAMSAAARRHHTCRSRSLATASDWAHAALAMSTRNLHVKPQVSGGFARRAPLSFNDIYRAHSDMRWQRDLMEQLDSIHGKMKDLSIKTKAVEGRPCYLETYTRKGYGVTLRWRASDHRHLTADRALKLIRRLQPTMRHWFNRAGLQAEQLNHSERALRAQLRTLQASKSGAGTERLL